MRRGNLPDTCHDNVISKRSRDQLTKRRNNVTRRRGGDAPKWCYWVFHLETPQTCTNGTSWIRTTETPRWRTTEVSIVVSFETCLRRRGDVLMWRYCYVVSMFQWDTVETYHNETSLRRSIETSLGVLFETFLWRRWDVKRDVCTT